MASDVLTEVAKSWRAAIRQVLVFRGRAGLAEYWWSVALVLGAVLVVQGLVSAAGHKGLAEYASVLCFLLMSVTVRRLHDANRSAWSLLVGLIPLVGDIFMLVWLVSGGTPGLNRYGPSPVLPRELAYAVTPQPGRTRRRVHIDAQGNVLEQADELPPG
jgi:uncharacterized membrane protein YhaH (DUF805 family)